MNTGREQKLQVGFPATEAQSSREYRDGAPLSFPVGFGGIVNLQHLTSSPNRSTEALNSYLSRLSQIAPIKELAVECTTEQITVEIQF